MRPPYGDTENRRCSQQPAKAEPEARSLEQQWHWSFRQTEHDAHVNSMQSSSIFREVVKCGSPGLATMLERGNRPVLRRYLLPLIFPRRPKNHVTAPTKTTQGADGQYDRRLTDARVGLPAATISVSRFGLSPRRNRRCTSKSPSTMPFAFSNSQNSLAFDCERIRPVD